MEKWNLVSSRADEREARERMKKKKKGAKGSYKNDSQSCLMHFSPICCLVVNIFILFWTF